MAAHTKKLMLATFFLLFTITVHLSILGAAHAATKSTVKSTITMLASTQPVEMKLDDPNFNSLNIKEPVIDINACQSVYCNTMLTAHNDYRSRHGARIMTLSQATDSSSYAKQLAQGATYQQSLNANKPSTYGENLAWRREVTIRLTSFYCSALSRYMADLWYREISDYDFATLKSKNANPTVHFTQLIWDASSTLGCGLSLNATTKLFYGVTRYTPTGNLGSFKDNVFPLKIDDLNSLNQNESTINTATCQAAFCDAMLTFHNQYRAKHGVPNLSKNNALSVDSQTYANQMANTGNFQHSSGAFSAYGENLSWRSEVTQIRLTQLFCSAMSRYMVDLWYNEIYNYDFKANAAKNGTVGHFTQLVWKASTNLGCGFGINLNNKMFYGVARYTPTGNWNNLNKDNVLPLK